jgi:hypothetical protein
MQKTRRSSPRPSENQIELVRRRNEAIHEWLEIYAAHYGYDLLPADVSAWQHGLAGVHPDDLKRAFIRTMKEVRNLDGFAVRPKVGDVLSRVQVDPRRDRKVGYLMPTRSGDCYKRECPEMLGPHGNQERACGCIDCAPHLYCRKKDCRKSRMRHLVTGNLLNGCIDHAAELDEPVKEAAAGKSMFRQEIEKLAKSKSMPGGDDGVEEVHIP